MDGLWYNGRRHVKGHPPNLHRSKMPTDRDTKLSLCHYFAFHCGHFVSLCGCLIDYPIINCHFIERFSPVYMGLFWEGVISEPFMIWLWKKVLPGRAHAIPLPTWVLLICMDPALNIGRLFHTATYLLTLKQTQNESTIRTNPDKLYCYCSDPFSNKHLGARGGINPVTGMIKVTYYKV